MKHARQSQQHIQDPSGKIPEDEPVFLLRAQDPAAAATVRSWAVLSAKLGCDSGMVALAYLQASKMDEWLIKKAVADMPTSDQLCFQFRGVDPVEEAPDDAIVEKQNRDYREFCEDKTDA